MDTQKFDAITRLAATSPDRRGALKLAGVAALLGATGFVARPDDASALVTVVITNVLNDLSVDIDIPIQNNNVAVQVCALITDINAVLVDDNGDAVAILTCDVTGRTGGGGGGGGQEARRNRR
jgi:hypothetical protein